MHFTLTQADLSFHMSMYNSQCISVELSKDPLPVETLVTERLHGNGYFWAHSTCRFKGSCLAGNSAKCCNKMSVFMINSIVKGHNAILLNLYQCGDCVNTEGNIIHPNQIKQAAVKLNQ